MASKCRHDFFIEYVKAVLDYRYNKIKKHLCFFAFWIIYCEYYLVQVFMHGYFYLSENIFFKPIKINSLGITT